jgi:toxin-antitoxin system PIN domain toxin
MIAVDTNILVAFHRTEYPYHPAAVEAVTSLAEGTPRWAIPWPCVHEFLAIVTNGRIFNQPTPASEALAVLDALMQSPSLSLIGEDAGYWGMLNGLIRAGGITGARVHDARIAAICLLHRVDCLWTADRDFGRFPALKHRNPLVGAGPASPKTAHPRQKKGD